MTEHQKNLLKNAMEIINKLSGDNLDYHEKIAVFEGAAYWIESANDELTK